MPDKWAQYAEAPAGNADKWAQYAEAPAKATPATGPQAPLSAFRRPIPEGLQGPPGPANYGFTPENIGKNLYEGAKGAVTGAAALGEDLLSNPNWVFGPNSTMQKFVTEPAAPEKQKAEQAFHQGNYSEALGHGLAYALPLVGPWAASLGEQAGKGDIGGAVGQLGGAAGVSAIGGKVAGKAMTAPEEINAFMRRAKSLNDVTKAGAGVYQGEIQPAIQKLQAAVQNEGAKTISGLLDADSADVKLKGSGSVSNAKISAKAAKALEETDYHPTKAEQAVLDELTGSPEDRVARKVGYVDADDAIQKLGKPVWDSFYKSNGGLRPGGMTLDQAVKLRSTLGNALYRREIAPKAAHVLGAVYNELTDAIGDRAKQLGGDQGAKAWSHYNNEFQAFYELKRNGITGDMMKGLEDRHESIPQLKKFSNADLTEVKEAMQKYGLDPSELERAQTDSRSVIEAHDEMLKKQQKSLMRLVEGGSAAGLVGMGTYLMARGAGLYGFAPYLLATYLGNKAVGNDAGAVEVGRILRKLGHDPEKFQVRTPVEGPQDFNFNPEETPQPSKAEAVKSARASRRTGR